MKLRATRRKAMAVGAAALAATAFVATPASAAPAAPASLARCANSVVKAMHDAELYSGWESTRVVGYVNIGENYPCTPGYKLGRRYTACGVSDGNGWLAVYGHSLVEGEHIWGYAVQACFADQ